MAERLASAGHRRSSSGTGRRSGDRLAERIGATRRRDAGRGGRGGRHRVSMLADDEAVRRCLRRPGRAARRARARGGGCRHASPCRPPRSGPCAGGARAAGAGSSTRPSRAASALAETRQADDHGRRRGGGPRARPAGPRARCATRLPPRAARHRRGDEARRQHADLRAQPGRGRGARPRRARPASSGRRAYDVLAASAAGAPFVGYKRAAFLEPETTPVAFSLDLAAKDLRLIADLAEAVGRGHAAGARSTSHAIERPPRTGGGDARLLAVASASVTAVGARRTGLTDTREGPAGPSTEHTRSPKQHRGGRR